MWSMWNGEDAGNTVYKTGIVWCLVAGAVLLVFRIASLVAGTGSSDKKTMKAPGRNHRRLSEKPSNLFPQLTQVESAAAAALFLLILLPE
ncbi:hypothetical protein HS088_TW02G00054 [Tripterygium wilfordii]|uniref:Uncharacterized protein n=1 Tax=Tripterygium wilfordii TaxID=458696 RepID=A0A7J7DXZ9_TRIWF|nr:hypothetical protein HS088_TW02G00054 [Tripterygium wilfordii]